LKGDTENVYKDIYSLGQDAFKPNNFSQIDLVLTETFKRVAFNLEVIYKELKSSNYQFTSNIEYDWQRPLFPPDTDTDKLLSVLKYKTEEVGFVPLSLEYFYKIVGSCNFCWDWGTNPAIPWEGADPIDNARNTAIYISFVKEGFAINKKGATHICTLILKNL
jgi:hypothetical protein